MVAFPPSLRRVAGLALLAGAMTLASLHPVLAEEEWRHGGTLFGELKYDEGFAHYEHVNPDAPKGGTFYQAVPGSFDSFNPFVVRGRAPAGLNYTGGLLYDTLFDQSIDQPSAAYGLVAEAFRHADDHSWASFRLHPQARWHDGRPITVEDVIWSLEVLKANQPLFTQYYRNVVGAEKTGEREVTFRFDVAGNRELPIIMGDMPVLPKHWWEGEDAQGNKRNIAEPLNEPPLGSGPYRIADFEFGNHVHWERVADYWGAELGPRKGRYNFDRIEYTYIQDENALWEAFKKGGISDTRGENRSQRWATEYDFPAFERGEVVRQIFPTSGSQTYQGFFFNLRKEKFRNAKLREALTLLFNYEFMNEKLFYGLYTRTDSYFEGGELQSSGLPEGRELEILEAYRGRIPERVFTETFTLPVHDSPGATRNHQRQAVRLFREAGYTFTGGRMLDANGEQLTIEFLGDNPVDERVTNPFIEDLRKLGIDASLRIVDTAQYKNRQDNFEYEIIVGLARQSLSPGNEQRDYWASASANSPGTRNYAGIADPVIDELVERIIVAPDRNELVALTRALDRVLLWNFFSIPQWHNPEIWFSWWNRVRLTEKQPLYTGIDVFAAWIEEPAGGGGN